MKTTTKLNKKDIIKPSFVQLSKTDFGPSYIPTREFEEQISFGYFDGYGGIEGKEVQIKWYKSKDGLKLKINELTDIEEQKKLHPKLFELLKDDSIQPDEFREKLLKLKYRDVSKAI